MDRRRDSDFLLPRARLRHPPSPLQLQQIPQQLLPRRPANQQHKLPNQLPSRLRHIQRPGLHGKHAKKEHPGFRHRR